MFYDVPAFFSSCDFFMKITKPCVLHTVRDFFFLKSWKSRNHVFSRCLSVSSRHKSIGYTFFLVDYVFFLLRASKACVLRYFRHPAKKVPCKTRRFRSAAKKSRVFYGAPGVPGRASRVFYGAVGPSLRESRVF